MHDKRDRREALLLRVVSRGNCKRGNAKETLGLGEGGGDAYTVTGYIYRPICRFRLYSRTDLMTPTLYFYRIYIFRAIQPRTLYEHTHTSQRQVYEQIESALHTGVYSYS